MEPVELVRAFVNTADTEDRTDSIATLEGLRGWLAEQKLGGHPSAAEHERAVALRDALRAAVRATSYGEQVDTAATEAALAPYRLRAFLDEAGEPRVAPADETGVGAVVAAMVAAQADGSWGRLKMCAEHSCEWVFYDRSRNRSGRWCSMRVCGNRTKTRAYRSRRRTDG